MGDAAWLADLLRHGLVRASFIPPAEIRALRELTRYRATQVRARAKVDMERFPSAAHLASWAGLCPGNKQSGGKRLSSATTKGNVWLRRILGEVAWAAIHDRKSIFRARYHRLKPRLGAQQAVVAIMHQLLTVIYHILKTGDCYHELGAEYYHTVDPQRTARRLTKRLERLGYTVLPPAAPAA